MRVGVHDERNRERDLSGEKVLISSHFYYFGDHPISLPDHLQALTHNYQGHKAQANQPYAEQFIEWIENLSYEPNGLFGEPQLRTEFASDPEILNKCVARDLEDDELEIC